MKLLVVLSVVGYCLAMPTPTNNATETLIRMMEKMKERLFSAQCVAENPTHDAAITVWTEPMQCMWPNMNNMSACVDQWVTMMGNTGCTVPSESMVKMLKRAMAHRNYENSPIIAKFPKNECGMCGRRIQCCPANPFLVQSYRSTVCESAPCQVEPMSTENWNYMREKYPEWTLPTTDEPCNFAAIMRESMMHSKVFPFMRTMYMQMVGSEMPTMNCHLVGNMCSCCCTGFVSKNGVCVPMTEVTTPVTTTMPITTMMPVVITTVPSTMMPEMSTTMMPEMPTAVPEMSMMTETMVELTTTTMPVVQTTMVETTVQTTTVHQVQMTPTPKTLFNVDAQMVEINTRKRRSAEKEDSEEDEDEEEEEATTLLPIEIITTEAMIEATTLKPIEITTLEPIAITTLKPIEETIKLADPTSTRKRRSAEKDDSSEEKEEQVVVVEKITEGVVTKTGEDGTDEVVAEVVAKEIIVAKIPEVETTEMPAEILITEAMTEGTTMAPIEETTMILTEATTIKLTEATTIKPININATIATLTTMENKEMTEAPIALPKVETPIMKDPEEKPATKE